MSETLKLMRSQNFEEQVEYLRNFLIELVAIYIQAGPEGEIEEKLVEVQNLLDDTFDTIKTTVFVKVVLNGKCPECGAKLKGVESNFCSLCGFSLKEIIER